MLGFVHHKIELQSSLLHVYKKTEHVNYRPSLKFVFMISHCTVPFTSKCTQTHGLTARNSGVPAGP